MDNAIDFHLLVLMTSNLDGITKNYNLIRAGSTTVTPNPKFSFVPWDYDGTFGRNWDSSPVDAKTWLSNRLFDRLLGNPLLQSQVCPTLARTPWQSMHDQQPRPHDG
ncbi:hypothetical protein EMGBS8_18070 [Verrucomicrobiota bacterium]|nr:hypothetical protein EMGBS8_18070 [Verrucomicrobiota bacterium]